ncbi:MAG: hypothetical protein AAF518_28150 [Spirochaetota bacterium]
MKYVLFFLLGFALCTHIVAQSRSDFYDPYDYDLRNYKFDKQDERYFREYELPPKQDKPKLVTPKDVRRPINPLDLFPGAGNLGNGEQRNRFNPNAANESVINPLTGELNVNILNTEQRRKSGQDWKKKKLAELPPYKESVGRRSEIIFFLTLPFGAAVFGGLTFLAGNFAGEDYVRTTPGALFILAGGAGVSYVNVYMDRKVVEKKHKEHEKHMSHLRVEQRGYSFRLYTYRF